MKKLLYALVAWLQVSLMITGGVVAWSAFSESLAENTLPTNRPSKHPNQSSIGRTRLGGFRTVQLGGDADWTCLANQAGTGGFVIPWNTSVEFSGAAGGWACFSMVIDGVDIAIDSTTGVITDGAGGDGLGTCFRMQAGRLYTQILEASHFTNGGQMLRADGVCAPDAGPTGAPCRQDNECAGVDGGVTCYGGTLDGGIDQIGAGNITGAYACWTSGAVDGVHLE